jgi:PIN domain nuclease of toxin-antitoxin system
VRLLLDTSAVLWWLDDNRRLGAVAREAVADADNEVFVSAATAWEIAMKRAAGTLEASFDIAATIEASSFLALPIEIEHAVEAAVLPAHHEDPFDRILVAQARLEGLTLVTDDAAMARYEVTVLPARD